MSILLFINLKGGVAKTTNAVATAECLAEAGHRVLLIDADHQCMAGELVLGGSRMRECDHRKKTLHVLLASMLDDEFDINQVAYYAVPNVSNIDGGLPTLSVIPCSVRIDDFQTNMAKAKRGYNSNDEFIAMLRKRRRALQSYLNREYDFTIVDCPPSVAVQVQFLLTVADAFIVPCIPDQLSVRGSTYLLDRIRRANLKVQGLGTLWSLYRQQNSMHRDVIEAVSAGNGDLAANLPRPFETIIPNATAIARATESDREYASFQAKYTPEFAKMYRGLCEEIVQRVGWVDARKYATVQRVSV